MDVRKIKFVFLVVAVLAIGVGCTWFTLHLGAGPGGLLGAVTSLPKVLQAYGIPKAFSYVFAALAFIVALAGFIFMLVLFLALGDLLYAGNLLWPYTSGGINRGWVDKPRKPMTAGRFTLWCLAIIAAIGVIVAGCYAYGRYM